MLWSIYAAALGAAWLSWPPALIRGNRLQAAAEAVGMQPFMHLLAASVTSGYALQRALTRGMPL